jgi:hypothetical protein
MGLRTSNEGRRASLCAAAIAVLATLGATPAGASVHISPGSPVGHEYVIPLGAARSLGGAPPSSSVVGAPGPSTPFGIGITPTVTAGSGATSSSGSSVGRGQSAIRAGHTHKAGGHKAAGQKNRTHQNVASAPAAAKPTTADGTPPASLVGRPHSGVLGSLGDSSLDLVIGGAVGAAVLLALGVRRFRQWWTLG